MAVLDGYLEIDMTWALAEAKDQLSEVVRRAVDEVPQTISVRGKETAVVLSKARYEALNPGAPPRNFRDHLLAFPKLEELDIERDPPPAGDFQF